MHHHTFDASESASVMINIGDGAGALILYTTADQLGREIEISHNHSGTPRTHAAVRERHLPDHTLHCVVYPSLPAGEYTVWNDDTTPAGTVTITGTEITEINWTDLPTPTRV